MISIITHGTSATAVLHGEIDHCSSQNIRAEIERVLSNRQIAKLVLDFTDVTFMDSSGVGMIIGRYKTMKARGGSVMAVGLSVHMERLFRLAGLHHIINVAEKQEAANG